jgi:response regulator RpfG family c-di-GMP phosphodiesterase
MSNRLRILFVDDERMVLDGLRNLLRRDRTRWDLSFAEGGRAALQEMADRPFDVVVSDMRMPGMDGPALLEQVKHEHPTTVRIVLSGQAQREDIARAVPAAHQFLSKPCSPDTLRRTIERIELFSRVVDGPTRAAIGALGRLASPATIQRRLHEALASGSLVEVAAVVAEDPGLALKALQLANWQGYGARRTSSTVEEAVNVLGLAVMEMLAVAPGEAAGPGPEEVSRLQHCANAVARLAHRVVDDPQRGDHARAAGLLHDLAPLALAATASLADPASAGAYLLTIWGLPEPLVDAVIHHRVPARLGRLEFDVLGAVHVAVALIREGLKPVGPSSETPGLDLDYLGALGLGGELPRWRALSAAEVQSCLDVA